MAPRLNGIAVLHRRLGKRPHHARPWTFGLSAITARKRIVRGVFERKLKLVGTHLGGGICEMIGRMDCAYELQDEAFIGILRANAHLPSSELLFEDDVSGVHELPHSCRTMRA
jgi:hypothetical protein